MQLKSMVQRKMESSMFNMNLTIIKMLITLSIFGLVLAGCSGGGSSGTGADSGTGATSANIVEGVLVDSPVEGVNYQTETHEGITDADGHFTCFDGEMVEFMIGDVVLGQAMADDVITLMDFLDDTAMPYDITNPMVINMGRFLQSLDADGDPENGITITPAMREEIMGRMIDFHQSVAGFENDADVVACFDTLNGLNMPHYGMMWELVGSDDALAHMAEYMGAHMGFGTVTEDEGTGGYTMGNGYMADRMDDYMDNSMGYTNTEGDDTVDTHMDGYMSDEMEEYMNDHMGYTDDDEDGSVDMPMDGFMDDEMIDYMNDHMGFGEASHDSSDSATADGNMTSSTTGSPGRGMMGDTGGTMGNGMRY